MFTRATEIDFGGKYEAEDPESVHHSSRVRGK